jgi:hypothetical protein
MAAIGSFVIKERIEGLEARVNTILDEERLRQFAQDVAREEIDVAAVDAHRAIDTRRDEVLALIKHERQETAAEIHAMFSHFKQEIRRCQILVGAAVVASILASILSILS